MRVSARLYLVVHNITVSSVMFGLGHAVWSFLLPAGAMSMLYCLLLLLPLVVKSACLAIVCVFGTARACQVSSSMLGRVWMCWSPVLMLVTLMLPFV